MGLPPKAGLSYAMHAKDSNVASECCMSDTAQTH